MNNCCKFDTRAFPAYPDEDQRINPDKWGMRLAEYLASELSKYGYAIDGEPFYEDWAACFHIECSEFPVLIGCSNVDEVEMGVILEPSTPTIKKGLFRKKNIDTSAFMKPLADTVQNILTSHEEVNNFRWENLH